MNAHTIVNRLLESDKDIARGYIGGDCDIMALALHRATGYPLGAWCGDFEFQGETETEFCHACVIVNKRKEQWMDVNGVHTGAPDNLFFSNRVDNVRLVPVTEEDVRNMFTVQDIEDEAIESALEFARRWPATKMYMT